MRVPFSTPVVMESDLSPDEVVRRLREGVESPFRIFAILRGGTRIFGRVQPDRFWVQYRTFYNNGFQRRLVLAIEPNAVGTSLRGCFTSSTATLVFGGLWFGFLLFFTCIWTVSLLKHEVHTEGGPDWINFLPYLMMLFGVGLWSFGLWLSGLTEPKTLAWVEATLNARIVDGG